MPSDLDVDAVERNADWTKDGVLDIPPYTAAGVARWLFDSGRPFEWLSSKPAYPSWVKTIPWMSKVEAELEKLNRAERRRLERAGVRVG